MIINKICSFFWFVFLLVAPFLLKAQPEEYRNDQGILVGTSDSRIFVTVNESTHHVEFQLCAIGEIYAGAFGFIIAYDSAVLRLTDPAYTYDMPNGYNQSSYPTNVVSVPESFSAKHPGFYTTPMQHRAVSEGDAAGLKFFCAETGMNFATTPPVQLLTGEIIHILNMHFRKVNPGTPLSTSDFGYYTESSKPPLLTSQWMYGAYKIKYSSGQPWDNFIVKPKQFTYRSSSYTTTENVTNIVSNSATLNATFTRGNIAPATKMMVAHSLTIDYAGRLNWDAVKQYGFIYSNTDATILVNGFSNKLTIDGVNYNFPDNEELAAGEFIRNGKTFYITPLRNNSSTAQSVSVSQNISGLKNKQNYYVWSFIYYTFETSNPYLFVGNKIMFKNESTDECPLTVDFEGGLYQVTSLAGLCWTSNMATRHYADGAPIAFARAYSCRTCPDSTDLASTFGLLYTWHSAVGVPEGSSALPVPNESGFVQGICPEGWHVPAQEELDRLNQYPVEDMRSTDYWLISGGTNSTGFNALPAGKYSGERNRFEDLYGFTGYWASDLHTELFANYYSITYYCNSAENKVAKKSDGLSVRCVMDY